MTNKKHLSLQEAASETGRSYWRLREAILRGELKASQFSKGGKFYVKPCDLESYFETNTVSPLSGKAA
jgi:hypothetical protein